MDERLDKLDAVMARAGVGAAEAKEALEASGWDIVESLAYIDRKRNPDGGAWRERLEVQAGELVDKVRHLLHEGNIRRITVRNDRGVLLDFPVTVGALGAVIVPELALLGVLAAMAGVFVIEIERAGKPPWRVGQNSDHRGSGPDDSQGRA